MYRQITNYYEINKSLTLMPMRRLSCVSLLSRFVSLTLSVIESSVPRRSCVSINNAADASWSTSAPFCCGCIAGDGFVDAPVHDGPRAGLDRRLGGHSIAEDGTRVRGENEGEVVCITC